MKDKEKQTKVFDILDKMELFQGQRAGRELWNDKPKEVQDKDISDFVRDINYIRSYLQDSVVLSKGAYESLSSKAKANVVNAIEIRKETAEKYNDKLVAIIQHLFDIGQIDFKAKIEFLKENEKILKQFGVERD